MGSIKGFQTLKTKKEFDRVYKNGKSFHTPFFVLFFLKADDKRFGFVASKKIGKAVKRNRAKRLLRSFIIPVVEQLGSGWYVLVAKPKILQTPYALMQKRFFAIIAKL